MTKLLEQLTPCIVDIFLQPGEIYFGDRDTRIRTLLGSCVSIVVWHPQLLIGGMSHCLLPSSNKRDNKALDGRYADDAVQLLLQEIKSAGSRPGEYEVKLFGGGNMFPSYARRTPRSINNKSLQDEHHPEQLNYSRQLHNKMQSPCVSCYPNICGIGCLNSAAARSLILRHGFKLVGQHVGGDGHRQIIFDIATGDTWVRQTPVQEAIKSDRARRK